MDFANELVDVVDQSDNVLKTIARKEVKNSDILRVTGVFIMNKKGGILLQLRSGKSFHYPLYWDCTGGGHVSSGEDYASSAKRELFEETGIKTELIFLGKHYIEIDDGRRHFIAFFKGEYGGNSKIDPNEVLQAKSFSFEELRKMIRRGEKIHPECLFGLKKYFL